MKPFKTWSNQRYRPAVHAGDEIYICRIAPDVRSIAIDWFPKEEQAALYWKEKDAETAWQECTVGGTHAVLEGLEEGKEYAFYLRSDSAHSAVGYAKTGFVPGTVVNYLHPQDPKYAFSGQHLCSPCLLRHPDGYLLVSMDLFAGRAPQNLTLIFRSDDNGETWYHDSELFPCFWGSLFMHRGAVYMLSVSSEYGDLLIGRSTDGGKTFLPPTVLFRGANHAAVAGWHKSSMPVIEHNGRIWCGVDYGSWPSGGHASCLLSADADGDLLDPQNWCISEPLVFDPEWKGAVTGDHRGFLEGNAVVLPNGEVGSILRYCTDRGAPRYGLVPILRGNSISPEDRLTFEKFVPFPGNLSKFDIRYDEVGKCYYAIVSKITDPQMPNARNVLSLVASSDLEHWQVLKDLLDYRTSDPAWVGFQYVSFQFDGEDLIYVSRTAFNGAKSYHDNNYVTFHRLPNFRAYKLNYTEETEPCIQKQDQ